MFDLLEMVARGITFGCDTEDVIRITSAVKRFCIAKRKVRERMITQFEHKFNIGDTVFLTFYSRGQYRVRKKTGYKIRIIRFNLSTPLSFAAQPEDKKEKSIYYWFEGKNPSVNMTIESACFATLEDAQKYCDEKNKEILR